ncbi:cation:proton antiporter [Pseudooctadecabacter sp.]|uniref:cation:proton antiporter n=1 Tax=Pseudooctadecabacter sp. TaxID=1966338 RepID=UPI0035C806C8
MFILSEYFGLSTRSIFYLILGLALMALTLQPLWNRYRIINVPLLFVGLGAILGGVGLPVLNPLSNDLSAKIVEHISELIVLISLAGAGLAIDTRESFRNWQATIRLLAIAMPLTILGVALLGIWVAGLPLASALLLAAVLAPTDPVLARSVQVSPPGQDASPLEVSLTAEAGLNDGLAFPFVYLALAVVAASGAGWSEWGWTWLGYDFIYRVVAGYAVGWGCGMVISKLLHSRYGDASLGAWNALIVVLASTFTAYGAAEAVSGYGFLAVFAAARAGRYYGDRQDGLYAKFVHRDADQLENVLLVILLVWFGMFLTNGLMANVAWTDIAIAAAILLVVRPLGGLVALVGLECEDMSRFKVAFFGIRGMGTVFYIAYAQNHAEFQDIDAIWRICAVTILMSMLVHGFAANFVLPKGGPDEDGDTDDAEVHPYHERAEAEAGQNDSAA